MSCTELRRALDRAGLAAARSARAAHHLADCADCSALVARLEDVRAALATQPEPLAPPPGFAARVVARLPRREELLGWAALRLLPASLAIAAVTGWLVATTPSPFGAAMGAGGDGDLVIWLLLAAGGAP